MINEFKEQHEAEPVAAEFHDIGKLINWEAAGFWDRKAESEPHDFERFVDSNEVHYAKPPWQAIWRNKQKFPGKQIGTSWLWCSIADQLSAGWGRGEEIITLPDTNESVELKNVFHGEIRGALKRNPSTVLTLWSDRQFEDERLTNESDVHDMISFLNSSPSWQDAIDKYGLSRWQMRAEEKKPPLNVTSLYGHAVVAGKLARVLASSKPASLTGDESWETISSPTGPLMDMNIVVGHYQIYHYQKPYRIKDWNIFSLTRDVIQRLLDQYPDNILSVFGFNIIAVFTSRQQETTFMNSILSNGFGIKYRSDIRKITDFLNRNNKITIVDVFTKAKWQHKYTENLPQRIDLPICEVCQMAYASRTWEHSKSNDSFEGKPEYICSSCFSLRSSSKPLEKLARWETGKAAWLFVNLDFDLLSESLSLLHRNYAEKQIIRTYKRFSNTILEFIKFRYPMFADFLLDYQSFLRDLQTEINRIFEPNDIEQVDQNLWCIHLTPTTKPIRILDSYLSVFKKYFPRLLEQFNSSDGSEASCPIRFSLSISNIKHPFFAHWRFLVQAQNDINIQIAESGLAYFKIRNLADSLNVIEHGKSTALHRLAEIASTSEILAAAVLIDKGDKDKKTFEKLSSIVPSKIDFQSFLTLTKLVED